MGGIQITPSKVDDSDTDLVGDLLWSPAHMAFGSGLDDEQLLQAASEVFAGQQVCIVRHWMIIQVGLDLDAKRLLKSRGLKPVVMYANTVVGAPTGNEFGVLSGYQRCFEDCFFQSDEMLFVLAGRGSCKEADEQAVRALARRCGIDPGGSFDRR